MVPGITRNHTVGVYILYYAIVIAVKAPMNLRVRKYYRGVTGSCSPERNLVPRSSVVCFVFFLQQFQSKKFNKIALDLHAFQIKEFLILQSVKFMHLFIRIRLVLFFW